MTVSPWNFEGESAPLSTVGPLVTVLEGRSFCISNTTGDIDDHGPQGMFYLDARYISSLILLINGVPIEPLGHDQTHAFKAKFVGRHVGPIKTPDVPLVVVRSRLIGQGMNDKFELRNYGDAKVTAKIELLVEADFANLFDVKEQIVTETGAAVSSVLDNGLRFEPDDDRQIAMTVTPKEKPDAVEPGKITWNVELEPGEVWTRSVELAPWLGEDKVTASKGDPTSSRERLAVWRDKIPKIVSDSRPLALCANKALDDLASLRIHDPARPDLNVVAAGAPWFMTLFGRDSLIASWMAMLVDPDLASGVTQTLAQFQGTDVNPVTEEEPGKIMHEIRFGNAGSRSLADGEIYYGTADASPLFVMLIGEMRRWGVDQNVIDRLIPNADAALNWMTEFGDNDGDGYIEYARSDASGLANQGWKDSGDGIRYGDGRIAEAPIALCEVQAYAYGAYRTRARLAEDKGDQELSAKWEAKATDLRTAFNRDFWLEDKEWFAVGLDGDKKPIDSLTSNIGHCLWTGIVEEDKAELIAAKLTSPEMFTGWGIRTLSSDSGGYNPTSYHVGSVWPHDTALVAAGLMRYDFVEDAHKVMNGLFDTGTFSEGRLPELLAGFSREEFSSPIAYPASCSPQAWAAAAPLLLLRWILRLDPWCDKGRVWIDPVLPEGVNYLQVSGVAIGNDRVSITVENDEVTVEGLSEDLDLIKGIRSTTPRERW